MAQKDFYVDINLHGNEIKNFAVENIPSITAMKELKGFNGRTVFNKEDGHIYTYVVDAENPSTGTWVKQAYYGDILTAISDDQSIIDKINEIVENNSVVVDLGVNKLDKITDANKVYGTDENGNQVAYNADSFGKVDDVKVGGTSVVTNKIAELGTMAGESKDDYVLTEIDNGANGKAYVWNEASGGGVRYEKDNNKVFVGVNGGNEGGEFVSIYAKNGTPTDTKRIIVKSDGAYYLKNDGIATTANDEIATKGDVLAKDSLPERTPETAGKFLTNDGVDSSWADLPEYTIAKDEQAETGYAHTYHLQKDGVNVGASINIPLDMVVRSGQVKVCEIDDDPVPGYKVGDKYIDLELANSDDSHLYILVSDLVDVYTEGDGINISNNTISVDTTDTTIVDTTPTANSVKFVQSGGVKTELDKKTDKEVQGTNGIARIFNEVDGGGAKFEHNDGLESFVGVNDGGENGLAAQIYADKLVDGKWQGAKLDVTNGGMYYTVGSESFENRAVAENEIATKGDITSAISNTKQVELSPILTVDANGEYTWTITNDMGEDAIVSLFKKDEQNRFVEVMADITITSSNVIIKMYESADLPSPINAGEFKAIILG